MASEPERPAGGGGEPPEPDASDPAPAAKPEGEAGARPPGYVDEFDPGGDYIAEDREARRDDVRNLGSGAAVGISCMVVVVLLVALFWGIRGCLMG